MATYLIRKNGKKVDTKKRIDSAQRAYDAVELEPGESKTLEKDGEEIASDTRKAKKSKPAGEKKDRKYRVHDNDDAVATALRGLKAREIAPFATKLLNEASSLKRTGKSGQELQLLTPGRIRKIEDGIERSVNRAEGLGSYAGEANPGSGRMSLGLTIRALLKILGRDTIEKEEVAQAAA